MSGRPWIGRCRHFFAYMRGLGRSFCAGRPFLMFGQVFHVVGMPSPAQACVWPRNDNGGWG